MGPTPDLRGLRSLTSSKLTIEMPENPDPYIAYQGGFIF